jgi:hypothetical protein
MIKLLPHFVPLIPVQLSDVATKFITSILLVYIIMNTS